MAEQRVWEQEGEGPPPNQFSTAAPALKGDKARVEVSSSTRLLAGSCPGKLGGGAPWALSVHWGGRLRSVHCARATALACDPGLCGGTAGSSDASTTHLSCSWQRVPPCSVALVQEQTGMSDVPWVDTPLPTSGSHSSPSAHLPGPGKTCHCPHGGVHPPCRSHRLSKHPDVTCAASCQQENGRALGSWRSCSP